MVVSSLGVSSTSVVSSEVLLPLTSHPAGLAAHAPTYIGVSELFRVVREEARC